MNDVLLTDVVGVSSHGNRLCLEVLNANSGIIVEILWSVWSDAIWNGKRKRIYGGGDLFILLRERERLPSELLEQYDIEGDINKKFQPINTSPRLNWTNSADQVMWMWRFEPDILILPLLQREKKVADDTKWYRYERSRTKTSVAPDN